MINRYEQLIFLEDLKSFNFLNLNEIKNPSYYKRNIFEYLNPNFSYEYEYNEYEGGKLWKCKYKNDPEFRVILKWSSLHNFYVLNFMFMEDDKIYKQTLEGKNYLDTLCKIIIEEIIPYIEKDILYFNAYGEDGYGLQRKQIFNKIIDKFIDKSKYSIEIEGFNFLIKQK